MEIKKLFCRIIDDTSDLKQLSDSHWDNGIFVIFNFIPFPISTVKTFSEIHEFIVLGLFLWALLAISRYFIFDVT